MMVAAVLLGISSDISALLPSCKVTRDKIFRPLFKVEKLTPNSAQNQHGFEQPVGGKVRTRAPASRPSVLPILVVCPQPVNSQELQTKSPGSDSSTHSHGGDSPRSRAERHLPQHIPAPWPGSSPADPRAWGRGGAEEEAGEGAPPGQTTVVWGRCLLQPEGPRCSEGLSPGGCWGGALCLRAREWTWGVAAGCGAWMPQAGKQLAILQVTLSFMGILKRMSGTGGFFFPFSSLSLSLTRITAVDTAGFLSQAWPGVLGSPADTSQVLGPRELGSSSRGRVGFGITAGGSWILPPSLDPKGPCPPI